MADLTASREVDTEAIADFVRRARDVERELRKVIVGQQEAVRQVLIALFAGGHAGADRQRRRGDSAFAQAVFRAGDPEPAGDGRDLSAARGAVGSLSV